MSKWERKSRIVEKVMEKNPRFRNLDMGQSKAIQYAMHDAVDAMEEELNVKADELYELLTDLVIELQAGNETSPKAHHIITEMSKKIKDL